jgi:transposase-like protein
MQTILEQLLEAEVTEFLGRVKHARRPGSAAPEGSRNGYGKPRRVALLGGTVAVRRPRLRDVAARFESRVLPFFKRRTEALGAELMELYLHGLAQGDFELALRHLLGDGAPLSKSSIARLTAQWRKEYERWPQRSLADVELVYAWADGVYVKAGVGDGKAALLVIIGVTADGQKRILAVESGHRESTERWSEVLRDLTRRGLRAPKCLVADGHLGIWGALTAVWPSAAEQRCWVHKLRNVLAALPDAVQARATASLREIMYAPTRADAEVARDLFELDFGDCPKAAATLRRDWDRLLTYYQFPAAHWQHLRTTNIIESPFNQVRIRTGAARRYKRLDNAEAIVWKLLLVAERRFRKLNGAELLRAVLDGVPYLDGKPVVAPVTAQREAA